MPVTSGQRDYIVGLIGDLFATLPTHNHVGAEIDLRWNNPILHAAVFGGLISSTDKQKSLRVLCNTLAFLDYALWTDVIEPGAGDGACTLVRTRVLQVLVFLPLILSLSF
jgi:hypothetical protein